MTRMALAFTLLAVSACGTSGTCEADAFSCDGTILSQCVDGEAVVQEDCADVDMMCHAEMGHCMADSGM